MIFRSTFKKPVLIAGSGVRAAGATDLLHRFYRKTKIPVLTTMNAVDLMQDSFHLGFIGVYGNRVANMIVREADCVIAVGARLGLRQIGNKPEFFAPHATLIRADIDQYELARDVKDKEEKHLVDAREFLEQLLQEQIPTYTSWNKQCFSAAKMLAPYDKEIGNKCIAKIASLLPQNPIVTVDVGQNQCWAAQSLHLKGHNGRILIGGSYGSMGCSLPYAIGACHALDKKTVYCISGDGGLQMNIQELQVISHEMLPIKIFCINNHALGKISEIQDGSYGKRFFLTTDKSGYVAPNFEKIAKAYGIKAQTIDGYQELDQIEDWLRDAAPCLINIMLPDATLLLPKMNWNQKEMLPAINKEVLQQVQDVLTR